MNKKHKFDVLYLKTKPIEKNKPMNSIGFSRVKVVAIIFMIFKAQN